MTKLNELSPVPFSWGTVLGTHTEGGHVAALSYIRNGSDWTRGASNWNRARRPCLLSRCPDTPRT